MIATQQGKNSKTINLSNYTQELETDTFKNCNLLETIILPGSITTIPDYAFYGCTKLTTIVIPNSVTSISKYVFDDDLDFCSTTIYCEATEKPSDWNDNWSSNDKIYWYSETSKSGYWHYDSNNQIEIWE